MGIPTVEATSRMASLVIGCAITVHRELGPGFLESVYRQAMYLELDAGQVPYEREKPIEIRYRGHRLQGQRVDLLVADTLIVELKAVSTIEPIHVSQLVSYLKATHLHCGLLVNFNVRQLRQGVRRVVL